MEARPAIDVTSAAARRRFFIDRARRKNTRGSGSDMGLLLTLTGPLRRANAMIEAMFGSTPVCLIGAYAAAAYAPERMTKDVDDFTPGRYFGEAEAKLAEAGWQRRRTLAFPYAKLGLYGSAWESEGGGRELDLIASDSPWAEAAFDAPVVRDRSAERVMPLEFLVLMKLDSARGIDLADVNRILGRLSPDEIERVVAVVDAHYDDPAAADDIRQSAEIGRWEYETEPGTS